MNDQQFWKNLRKAYNNQIPPTDSASAWDTFEVVLDQQDKKKSERKRRGFWIFLGIAVVFVSIFILNDKLSTGSDKVSNLSNHVDIQASKPLHTSQQDVKTTTDVITTQSLEQEEIKTSDGLESQRTFTENPIINEKVTIPRNLIDPSLSRSELISRPPTSPISDDAENFAANAIAYKHNIDSGIQIMSNGSAENRNKDMRDTQESIDFLSNIYINVVSENNELLELEFEKEESEPDESNSNFNYLVGVSFNTGYQNQRSIVRSSALGMDVEGRLMWKRIYVSALAQVLNVENTSYVLSQSLGLYDPKHISLRNSLLEEIDISARYLDLGLSIGYRIPLWSRLSVEVASGIVKKTELNRKVNYQILNNRGRQEISLMSQTVVAIPIYTSIDVTALVFLKDNINFKFTYNKQFHLFMTDIKYPDQEMFNTGVLISF